MIDPKTQRPHQPDPVDYRAEVPDAHGIRRNFVAHIRELIAAGHYDAADRWALAEELLYRRLEEAH